MVRRRALFLALLAGIILAISGCCGGWDYPAEELSVRWANAACDSRDGLSEWDTVEVDGHDAETTTALCRDGSAWVQGYQPDDSASKYETPVEVRARQDGEL